MASSNQPAVKFIDGENPIDYVRRAMAEVDVKYYDVRVCPSWCFSVKDGKSQRGAYLEYKEVVAGKRDKWKRLSGMVTADSLAEVLDMWGRGLDAAAAGED